MNERRMSNSLADADPGIRRVVAWLRDEGFETTDSGDGVTKIAQGFTPENDGVLDVAHVHMVVAPAQLIGEADRLARLVRAKLAGVRFPNGADAIDAVIVDATYMPLEGVAVLSLFGVSDAELRSN
jgi:hypothetical protein